MSDSRGPEWGPCLCRPILKVNNHLWLREKGASRGQLMTFLWMEQIVSRNLGWFLSHGQTLVMFKDGSNLTLLDFISKQDPDFLSHHLSQAPESVSHQFHSTLDEAVKVKSKTLEPVPLGSNFSFAPFCLCDWKIASPLCVPVASSVNRRQ